LTYDLLVFDSGSFCFLLKISRQKLSCMDYLWMSPLKSADSWTCPWVVSSLGYNIYCGLRKRQLYNGSAKVYAAVIVRQNYEEKRTCQHTIIRINIYEILNSDHINLKYFEEVYTLGMIIKTWDKDDIQRLRETIKLY
jgi:hypothetical protein